MSANSGDRDRSMGPYRLERLIGRGGMGAVYLAHRFDGQFEQRVAIKFIDRPQGGGLFRERLRRERQILANLNHPYITRLLDGGVSEEGELYLVMEYVEGVPLLEFLRASQPSLRERLGLFEKVCAAVQFAHQNLVIHRDLKPDNILIAADRTPRLLDFGMAKLIAPDTAEFDTHQTVSGQRAYTPRYASPEQVMGEPVTTATDSHALGVLLFVMLTEVTPFNLRDDSVAELVRVVCAEPPPRLSTVAAAQGMPFAPDADLDAIVQKALRKEPSERYVTVDALSADVTAWLDGRPVSAHRGSRRYRAVKFMRRHKISLLGTAALAVSVLGALVSVVWQSRLADRERRRAESRSEDLRELSRSLLSEIDGAIKELPGSTPVQRLLVSRVLSHLDRVRRESNVDARTQIDLVEAYARLGDLQGNPYEQNIGDPAGAARSLDVAIGMARALHAARPRDPAVLSVLVRAEQSRGEVLFGTGETRAAIGFMNAAVAANDELLALPGATAVNFGDAASTAGALGDLLGQNGVASLGDLSGALAAYRKALELSRTAVALDPSYTRSRRGIAIDLYKIGNTTLNTDPRTALADYRRSLMAWEDVPAAERLTASNRRILANTHGKVAAALDALDEFSQAVAEFDQVAETFQFFAAADTQDNRARLDLAMFYFDEAVTLVHELNAVPAAEAVRASQVSQRAVDLLQKSRPLFEQLLASTPDNRSRIADLAYVKVLIGSLQEGRRAGSGAVLVGPAFGVLTRAAAAADASIDVLDMATTAGLTVLPRTLRDPTATLECARRLDAETKHSNPAFMLSLARALKDSGHDSQAAAVARQALALLPPDVPDVPTPRLGRELRALGG